MARFLKQPQQQLVQMGSPLDVDFYSKILDKSQQNRNQAVGMQMEYVDKINNLPIYTETDRAATSGKVQDRLTKMLDKSFVTPSQMARTVMELNQEITPGIQALKAKDQAAQMYDKMRVQYGANALMGTDPRNIDITDASGRYRNPGSYRALGVNLDDVRKNFLLSNAARLAQPNAPTYTKGGNVPAGYIQTTEKTGLSVDEITTMYAPGSPLAVEEAKKQLQSFPDFIEIAGGEQQAMDYLMNLNQQTAMANAQKVNYGLVGDQTYEKPLSELDKLNIEIAKNKLNGGIPNIPGRALAEVDFGDAAIEVKDIEEIFNRLDNPEKAAKALNEQNKDSYGLKTAGTEIKESVTQAFVQTALAFKDIFTGENSSKEYYEKNRKTDKTPKVYTAEEVVKEVREDIKFLKEDPDYKILYDNVRKDMPKVRPTDPEYIKNEAKIEAAFLSKVYNISKSLEAFTTYSRSLSYSEAPLLFDDMYAPNEDGELPLYKVKNGKKTNKKLTIGEDVSENKQALQASPIRINPVKGVIELNIGGSIYQPEILDISVENTLSMLKTASSQYFKLLKSGADSEKDPRILELDAYVRDHSAALYKYINMKYTKASPDKTEKL